MSIKTTVSVSVLAANYNNGKYLEAFIQSVLASTVLPCQLIIVDDCSTDGSQGILQKYEHLPFAEFIYLDKNIGFANALNKGIGVVKGEFVMRADPDDLLHPAKIKLQHDFLKLHPEICGVGCNVVYFHDVNGSILNNSNFPVSINAVEKAYRKGEHGMQHPTVMLRTAEMLDYTYRQETVPAEDYDLFARMVSDGCNYTNIGEVLYSMRVHPSSSSSNLSYDLVEKTFALRDEIFHTNTSIVRKWLYFGYIRNYRKYLLKQNKFLKGLHLIIAIFCQPLKLIKRIGNR